MAIPMKLIIDCSTGGEALVPLSQAEIDQQAKDQAAAAVAQQAAAAAATQRATDLATVKAKAATDPAFAALARLLGA